MATTSSPTLFSSIAAGVALSVILAGCNPVADMQQKAGEKMAETMIESATGGKVDIDAAGKNVKVTTADGTYMAGQQSMDDIRKVIALPDWLVSDDNNSVAMTESNKQKTIYGALKSQKSLAETKAYWVQYFTTEGYQDVSKTEVNNSLLLAGKKDDDQTSLTVTVSQDEQSSAVAVAIMFSTKKE